MATQALRPLGSKPSKVRIITHPSELQTRGKVAQCPFCPDKINVRGVMTHLRFKHPLHIAPPARPLKTMGLKGKKPVQSARLPRLPYLVPASLPVPVPNAPTSLATPPLVPTPLVMGSFEEGLRIGLRLGVEMALAQDSPFPRPYRTQPATPVPAADPAPSTAPAPATPEPNREPNRENEDIGIYRYSELTQDEIDALHSDMFPDFPEAA